MKTLTTILLLLALTIPIFPDDCKQAQQLYEKGNTAKRHPDKIEYFQKSITLCPTFAAYYMLGETYMRMDRFRDAIPPLKEALKLNMGAPQAFWLLGDAYNESGNVEEALFNYKAGLSLKPSTTYEKRSKEMRIKLMQKGTNSDTIHRFLERGIKYRAKGGKSTPSIDAEVHFDFDKATLSSKGKAEAGDLGDALKKLLKTYNPKGIRDEVTVFKKTKENTYDFKFLLIGHTDSRGPFSYNDILSLKRAETVKGFLVKHFGILENFISTKGKGKREMLIPNAQTEKDHETNRRVEILVIGQ